MSTQTLTPATRQNVVLFSGTDFGGLHGVKKYKKVKEDGTRVLALEGVAVFRSGTFRDSMGFEHTWEDIHMSQMIAHFDMLRENHLFVDVPVRGGHPALFGNPMDTLIGYHTGLSSEKRTNPADGKEYTYLLANYEILDPDAQDKVDRGLWRNRSSEVGNYVTNSEAEFWPVYHGFAYVDIPAVEGLNFEMVGAGTKFALMTENEKEAPVSGTENSGGNGPTEGQGTPSTEESNGTEEEQNGTEGTEDEETEGAEGTGGEGAPDTSQHSRPGTFRLFGQESGDPTAVQTHINSLETFQKEQNDAARKGFVSSLVHGKKIVAPQQEGYETLVLGMSDEQYSQFKSVWESAPALPLLQSHSEGTSNHNGQAGELSAEEAEISTLQGIVRQHQLAGMSKEQIEATESYKRLQILQQSA